MTNEERLTMIEENFLKETREHSGAGWCLCEDGKAMMSADCWNKENRAIVITMIMELYNGDGREAVGQ